MTHAATDCPSLPRLAFDWPSGADFQDVLTREWLVSNGRGGYASGTVARCNTRRYHGLLIPSLEKKGRTVLLARLGEQAVVGGKAYRLDTEEHADGTQVTEGATLLRSFHLDGLVPHWVYQVGERALPTQAGAGARGEHAPHGVGAPVGPRGDAAAAALPGHAHAR